MFLPSSPSYLYSVAPPHNLTVNHIWTGFNALNVSIISLFSVSGTSSSYLDWFQCLKCLYHISFPSYLYPVQVVPPQSAPPHNQSHSQSNMDRLECSSVQNLLHDISIQRLIIISPSIIFGLNSMPPLSQIFSTISLFRSSSS